MPTPNTTPKEHDVPTFQPGQPTPDDPRKESPMKDPPLHPESDIERAPRTAGDSKEPGDIERIDPSPDRVLYNEDRVPG